MLGLKVARPMNNSFFFLLMQMHKWGAGRALGCDWNLCSITPTIAQAQLAQPKLFYYYYYYFRCHQIEDKTC